MSRHGHTKASAPTAHKSVQPPVRGPTRNLFIASEVRSGSTWLAELIAYFAEHHCARMAFGLSFEFFRHLNHHSTADDVCQQFDALWRDSGGLATGKLQCASLSIVCREALRSTAVRDRFFGEDTLWIVLRRQDRLRQAVSLAAARRTGQYHHYGPAAAQQVSLDIPPEEVNAALKAIGLSDDYLRAFADFVPSGRVLRWEYNEVRADPEHHLQTLFDELGWRFPEISDQVDRSKLRPWATDAKEQLAGEFSRWFLSTYHYVSPASVRAALDKAAPTGTDLDWERWGAQDPYFGVLTNPKFRASALTDEAKAEFMASGQWHVDYLMNTVKARFLPDFQPTSILDFGCGVGRLLLPFRRLAPRVVGVDVSPSMLAEARRNCEAAGVGHVALVDSDDDLSQVDGPFDLVHSCIVLQHIEIPRGRRLFERMVECVAPGGIGALHVTYGWDAYPDAYGQPPPALPAAAAGPETPATGARRGSGLLATLGWQKEPTPTAGKAANSAPEPAPPAAGADPVMQMNYYNLSELTFILHRCGVRQMQVDFTDHGGALGVFIFFQKPDADR